MYIMEKLKNITIQNECKNLYLLFNCYIHDTKNEKELVYKNHIQVVEKFHFNQVYSKLCKKLIERQKNLLSYLSKRGYKTWHHTFLTKSPLLVGLGIPHPSENGYYFRQPYGYPTIPASSIKGIARHFAVKYLSITDEKLDSIFGSQKKIGEVIFFDAIPEQIFLKTEILNPHYQDYYSTKGKIPPADYLSPVPITFLAVDEGSKFFFSIATQNNDLLEETTKILIYALKIHGIGAKTNTGYGILE